MDNLLIMNIMWDAVKASEAAGKAILEIYDTDFSVSSKSDNSPLTRADMEAHSIISDTLGASGLPLLSEEGRDIPHHERKDWHVFWLVDPLDGTKEFVNRNGEFTVNIALIKDSFPIAGVIYIPVTDELFLGIPGKDAMKFKQVSELLRETENLDDFLKSGSKIPIDHDQRPFMVVCSRSHMTDETEEFIEELKTIHGDVGFASRGSSLKLCMVAEGEADIYPRFAPTMEWDTAAGQAIAELSGAEVVNAQTGRRLQYNKEDLLNPWFIVKRS